MRRVACGFLMVLLAAGMAGAQDFLARKAVGLGRPVPDFELPDTSGNPVKLSSFKDKIVMIHFWSATCPYVDRYEERLQSIAKDYAGRGVVVFGIASNVNEKLPQIQTVAQRRGVNYPILLDEGHKIADQFGGVTTPHVYILDPQGTLVYEGGVDDELTKAENDPTVPHARNALDALLAGAPVPVAETRPFGCTIKRH